MNIVLALVLSVLVGTMSHAPATSVHLTAAKQGTNFPTAQLSITERNKQITVSFSDVFISSYKEDLTHQSTTDGGAIPLEMVSLNFAKVEIQVGGKIK